MKGYVVDKSPIHGKGVFASQSYEPGDYIGVAIENGMSTPEFGKWLNHRDDPNAIVDFEEDGKYHIYAGTKIGVGDEITVDYTTQPTLAQPEEGWRHYNPNRRGGVQERMAKAFDSMYSFEFKYLTEIEAVSGTYKAILNRAKKMSDAVFLKMRTQCSQFIHIGGITTKKKRLRYIICQEKAQLNGMIKLKTVLEATIGACRDDAQCKKQLRLNIRQLAQNIKIKRERIKRLQREYAL